jgi:hypothetical protein
VDTLLALYPNDRSAKALREWLRQATTPLPVDTAAAAIPRPPSGR